MRTELDPDDDDDHDQYWYEPPREETSHRTSKDLALEACKSILEKLGPALVVAGGGGAYREHLENPPPGPGDTACECPACQRLIELCQTMPREAAIARTLEALKKL